MFYHMYVAKTPQKLSSKTDFFPPYSMIKTFGCVYCLLALCLLLAPSAKYLYKTTMGAKIEKSVPNK